MEQKIKSISEAYSMQPACISVSNKDKVYAKEYNYLHILEIKLETLQVGTNTQADFYVGYDFNGNKSFQYLANSVNVHYYYE
jgi:hypothetical protein